MRGLNGFGGIAAACALTAVLCGILSGVPGVVAEGDPYTRVVDPATTATTASLDPAPAPARPLPTPYDRYDPTTGYGRPTPVAHRRVARPAHRIPYFAPRAGQVPPTGSPRIAGVQLPAGHMTPHYWVTDRALDPDRAVALAARLADAFPRTGLWPVLWDYDGEGPSDYAYFTGRVAPVARQSPLRVLDHQRYGSPGRRLRALAHGSRLPARTPNPFRWLMHAGTLRSSPGLMVVPVNRPADVLALTGVAGSASMSLAAQTAVARSFEERFGAVVTTLMPSEVAMVASSPPRRKADALALAREQSLFSDDDDHLWQDVAASARWLRTAHAPEFWDFGTGD